MKIRKIISGLALALALSACSDKEKHESNIDNQFRVDSGITTIWDLDRDGTADVISAYTTFPESSIVLYSREGFNVKRHSLFIDYNKRKMSSNLVESANAVLSAHKQYEENLKRE